MEKAILEANTNLDEWIIRLARIRTARKLLQEEESLLVNEIKGLADPSVFDEILALRDGKLVPVVYYRNSFPRFDFPRFRNDHEDLYKEYQIVPAMKCLYLGDAALPKISKDSLQEAKQ